VATQTTIGRNVKVVSLVSFLQDAASEMLYPIMPFFVIGILGAPPAVLGLIDGLADGIASVIKAASGRLADRGQRRPLVAGGYGISALGKAVLALAGSWPVVLIARCTDRVGKGLRGPPRDAIIAAETTQDNRGRAFGLHRAADTAGAVVGPLIGLGMFHAFDERIRPVLWIALIPAVLSVAAVFLIREQPRRVADTRPRLATAELPRQYWRLIRVVAVFALVNFPDTLLLLRAKGFGYDLGGVVALYVLYNLSYAIFSYPAGLISDRLDRCTVFAVGLGLFAVTYFGLGIATAPGLMWVLFPMYGGYAALTDGVSRAWVADLAPLALRSTALGVHAAVSGFGLVLAGVWAGLAWGDDGRTPLVISGVVTAFVATVLLSQRRSFATAGGH
jgi:MFS family permease